MIRNLAALLTGPLALAAALVSFDAEPVQVSSKGVLRLALERDRVLQVPRDVALPTTRPIVGRHVSGRYVLVTADRYGLAVFDATGRFERSIVVGRPSGGARGVRGTFISHLVPGPNSALWLYLADKTLVELMDSLEVGRPRSMPYPPTFVRADGSAVVALQIPERDLLGQPIHLVGPDGVVRQSFGLDTPEYRRDLRLALTRRVAPGRDGTVWSIAPGRYTVERWRPDDAARLESIDPGSDWFVPSDRPVSDERRQPTPIVESLWEGSGVLFVLTRVADERWQPPADPNVERPHDAQIYSATFDWVLEAIDVETGRVLASRRLSDAYWPTLSYGRLSSLEIGAAGEVRAITVWSVHVQSQEGS
jgi:hypothetical protein